MLVVKVEVASLIRGHRVQHANTLSAMVLTADCSLLIALTAAVGHRHRSVAQRC